MSPWFRLELSDATLLAYHQEQIIGFYSIKRPAVISKCSSLNESKVGTFSVSWDLSSKTENV